MRVVTLVPWRPSPDPRRNWCWDMTLPALQDLGYEIFTGEPPFKAWARSHAVNAAAKKAGKWDVALIGDADTVPDIESIKRAVSWVQSTGGAARPHHDRRMLSKTGTVVFCQRGPEALTERTHFDRQWGGGGLVVVTREAWEEVGGFDERFVGWGHEDTAFALSLLTKATWDRLPGAAWHLWHSMAENTPNQKSTAMYRELLKTHKKAMDKWAEDKGLGRKVEEIF